MAENVEFFVNGVAHIVSAEPDTPLIYILRNDLKLKGARFGCGLGQCGACNVLIDGRNVQSCDTPLWAAAGKRITTIEGLNESGRAHALLRAFVDEQAAQCGYCVPGVIMSAAALLEANTDPSDGEIRAALDRNLCRCGTYGRFVRAIRRAAREMKRSLS